MTKKKAGAPRRMPWPLALAIQLAAAFAVGFAGVMTVSLGEMAGSLPYNLYLWALMPAAELIVAYRATRRGLNNYAAWIAPPAAMWLTHYWMTGYSPAAAPSLIGALLSIVGAAAGEVMNQRRPNVSDARERKRATWKRI